MARARPRILLTAAAALLIVSGEASTQFVAWRFHYPIEFGRGLLSMAGQRLYAPWAILVWYRRYHSAYPKTFDLAALLGLLVLGAPAAAAIAASRRAIRKPKPFGADSWARLEDVEKAGLVRSDAKPVGRILGRFEGKLLTYAGVEHGIIVAPSRSGKGAGHVVPTACAWPQSIFVYDRKGELWEMTADHRKKFSHVFYFAPTEPTTARWNPLFEVRKGPFEVADVQNYCGIFIDPLGHKQGALDFWERSASAFLVAVILHVLYVAPREQKNLSHVRQLLTDIEKTLDAMLSAQHRFKPDPEQPGGVARDKEGRGIPECHPEVWMGASALRAMETRVRSNVLATALAALELFADPMVSYATSDSDFCMADLVCAESPVSFYMITPPSHADRLAFLVRAMLRATFNSLMEHQQTDSRGAPKKHRLLLLLDEFPKLGALPFMERSLGDMAGYGITAHLICQSFYDVYQSYGPSTTIFDNMHLTVAFATSEPKSIRGVIERAGKASEMRESFSSPATLFGRGHFSRSISEQRREILGENDVRELAADKELIFVNNTKPIIADKLRYYEDTTFRDWVTDYHHGERASFRQADRLDVPRRPVNDWAEVKPVELLLEAVGPMAASKTLEAKADEALAEKELPFHDKPAFYRPAEDRLVDLER